MLDRLKILVGIKTNQEDNRPSSRASTTSDPSDSPPPKKSSSFFSFSFPSLSLPFPEKQSKERTSSVASDNSESSIESKPQSSFLSPFTNFSWTKKPSPPISADPAIQDDAQSQRLTQRLRSLVGLSTKPQPNLDPDALSIVITEDTNHVKSSELLEKIKANLQSVNFEEGDFTNHNDYKSIPNDALKQWDAPHYSSTDREIAIPHIYLKESKKGTVEMTLYIPDPSPALTSSSAPKEPSTAFNEKIKEMSEKTKKYEKMDSAIDSKEKQTMAQRAFVGETLKAFDNPKVTIKKDCQSAADLLQVLSAIEMMVNNSSKDKIPHFDLKGIKMSDTLKADYPDLAKAMQDHISRSNKDPKSTLIAIISQVEPLRTTVETLRKSSGEKIGF